MARADLWGLRVVCRHGANVQLLGVPVKCKSAGRAGRVRQHGAKQRYAAHWAGLKQGAIQSFVLGGRQHGANTNLRGILKRKQQTHKSRPLSLLGGGGGQKWVIDFDSCARRSLQQARQRMTASALSFVGVCACGSQAVWFGTYLFIQGSFLPST